MRWYSGNWFHRAGYEYPNPDVQENFFDLSLAERAMLSIESSRAKFRLPVFSSNLFALNSVSPLDPDDIPLVLVARNCFRFISPFLEHYRRLGVTRFICVDDASTDGTRERLAAEADVDLFGSDVRYREAGRGRAWREALFNRYGKDRWYLNVDSDEFLLYEKEAGLRQAISALEARGVRRMAAPMIDFYPADAIADAHFDGSVMPWKIAGCFDAKGYDLQLAKHAIRLRGGVRRRIFGSKAELIKYPLIRWQSGDSLSESIHHPLPFAQNFSPLYGILMHFKLFSDFKEEASAMVQNSQHHKGAKEYRLMMSGDRSTFAGDATARYEGASDFIERGFFKSLLS